jgi:hypothetical protein
MDLVGQVSVSDLYPRTGRILSTDRSLTRQDRYRYFLSYAKTGLNISSEGK